MKLPSIFNTRRAAVFVRLSVNGLTQAALTVCSVLLIRWIFDHFMAPDTNTDLSRLLPAGAGLILGALALGWLQALERVDAEKLGQDYVHQIRMRLFRHMSALGTRALQRRSRGAVALRFIGDLNALKRWVSMGLVRVGISGTATLVCLAVVASISWRLSILLCCILGVGIGCTLRLGTSIRETSRESRRRRAFLAANVNEKVASMSVVQVFGQEQRERKRLRRQSEQLTESLVQRARKIGLMRGTTRAMTALASSLVLLEGAREVALGLTTPGAVVATMSVVGFLLPLLRDLGRVYEYWQDSRVSVEKLMEFLQAPAQLRAGKGLADLKPGPGHLELKHVCLDGVLHDISATVPPGSRIVVVGANGAGKSTLLAIIARMVMPDKGKVLLDGQNIGRCNPDSLRTAISMVSPDLPLLRGSLRKNLLYRFPDAPAQDVERVWNLCGIDAMLKGLPLGDQTRVTEEGANFSLGQRQRICMARALLGDPKILLLDEADVYLDGESTRIFERIIRDFPGTVIRISHNHRRITESDEVWLLQDGDLRPMPHEQIMDAGTDAGQGAVPFHVQLTTDIMTASCSWRPGEASSGL